MRSSLAFIVTGLTIPTLLLSPLAYADPESSRDIRFKNLTRLDNSPDLSLCEHRYGAGYVVSPSKEDPRRTYTSDKGHTVTLIDRSEATADGIYIEYDRFNITYPGDKKSTEVTQFVTGMTKNHSYSGVFSDGTCAGQVFVTLQPVASPQ